VPAVRRPAATLAAFVLHQYDWSETSLIVDLFTREQGRVVVAAKGAKRPYSQLRPVLLPFQRIQVGLGRAARAPAGEEAVPEVQTLRSAEWGGGTVMPGGAALFSGFYLNELLMKLLARHDPHPGLFDVYAATLPALGAETPPDALRDDGRAQAALRAFELKLLQEVGLLPDLSLVTATQTAVEPGLRYRLQGDAGVVARLGDGELDGASLIEAQAALQHGSLAALQQACAKALPGWRTALRGVLQSHLGSSVLRTRQLMIELQTLER
jgi:DNA repair protein RecO (recombination protein O)